MIKFLAKRAPKIRVLLLLTVGLAFLFFINWALSAMMGTNIVKYEGACVVGEYNEEIHSGNLTCGDYKKDNGNKVMSNFVGKVYIQKVPVSCKITEHEYTGKVIWTCNNETVKNDE